MSSWIFATWRDGHVLELRDERVQLDAADGSDHPQTRIAAMVPSYTRAMVWRRLLLSGRTCGSSAISIPFIARAT